MFSGVSDEELQENENNFADSPCKDGTDRKGYNPGKDNIAFNTPLDCRLPLGCPAYTILQTIKLTYHAYFRTIDSMTFATSSHLSEASSRCS